MPIYKAPTRDTRFVVNELIGLEHYANLPGFANAARDLTDAVIEEGGRFVSEVVAPLNQIGDREGCTRHADGSVRRARATGRRALPRKPVRCGARSKPAPTRSWRCRSRHSPRRDILPVPGTIQG
jgi:hypothetical protein